VREARQIFGVCGQGKNFFCARSAALDKRAVYAHVYAGVIRCDDTALCLEFREINVVTFVFHLIA
jgi:hypothetical protein